MNASVNFKIVSLNTCEKVGEHVITESGDYVVVEGDDKPPFVLSRIIADDNVSSVVVDDKGNLFIRWEDGDSGRLIEIEISLASLHIPGDNFPEMVRVRFRVAVVCDSEHGQTVEVGFPVRAEDRKHLERLSWEIVGPSFEVRSM